MQIPIHVKFEDRELPPLDEGQTRLVVAAGGVYRERRTQIFTSSARVEGAGLELADHYQYCRLHCGKLNRAMHRAMLSFFQHAHALHNGEAALVLLYDPERSRFHWHCPRQTIEMHWSYGRWWTSDHIRFDNPAVLPDGYLHFGDAHLHNGSVAPSMTDLNDDQDGLHIIAADVDKEPRYHIDFVVDGRRFHVAPNVIFEDPDCLPLSHAPRSWLLQIQVRRYVPYSWSTPRRNWDLHDDNGRQYRSPNRYSDNGDDFV